MSKQTIIAMTVRTVAFFYSTVLPALPASAYWSALPAPGAEQAFKYIIERIAWFDHICRFTYNHIRYT